MSTRDQLETTLRTMDPADPAVPELSPRARADLDLILSTRRDDSPEPRHRTAQGHGTDTHAPGEGALLTRRGRHPRWRTALVAAAAIAVAGVGIGLPAVTAPAYAGWEAVPTGVDVPGTQRAGDECRAMWENSGAEESPGISPASDLRVALTESRGPFTFTVMRGPEGQFADCLLSGGWSGRASTGGGGTSPAPPTPDPEPTGIDLAMAGAVGGERTRLFGLVDVGEAGIHTYAYGRVGHDVTALTLHTPRGPVQASLQAGLWAGWWPSEVDHLGLAPLPATITLRDGTTRDLDLTDVQLDWSEPVD
ncbi:hypothetical protein ACQBAT_14380 [Ornithinimicrobium sp. Y1847]|uniref:hypothetical protein n=1 Tax=unclassified Ornithinimicrobium TaxID=2615080 RepID=UPI003B67E3A3